MKDICLIRRGSREKVPSLKEREKESLEHLHRSMLSVSYIGRPTIFDKTVFNCCRRKNVYWVYDVLFCGPHDAWWSTIGFVFNFFFFINQKN